MQEGAANRRPRSGPRRSRSEVSKRGLPQVWDAEARLVSGATPTREVAACGSAVQRLGRSRSYTPDRDQRSAAPRLRGKAPACLPRERERERERRARTLQHAAACRARRGRLEWMGDCSAPLAVRESQPGRLQPLGASSATVGGAGRASEADRPCGAGGGGDEAPPPPMPPSQGEVAARPQGATGAATGAVATAAGARSAPPVRSQRAGWPSLLHLSLGARLARTGCPWGIIMTETETTGAPEPCLCSSLQTLLASASGWCCALCVSAASLVSWPVLYVRL